ncbi:MAG: amidohydrolase family protein, partial [Rhodothermales bacterium]|nr:amidohydrolase family protein [Rhodothermales bacterium]
MRYLLPILVVALAACQPPEYDLSITDVTVVDAVSGARPGMTVLTRGDSIAAIIPASESARAMRVVDGGGGYLVPGLWDMHVHLTYADADADQMARLFLDHGVTSVRDTGGLLAEIKPVVERLRAAEEAPRVFFAGPLLDGADVVYDGTGNPEIGIANPDPATAGANVTRLAAEGVD